MISLVSAGTLYYDFEDETVNTLPSIFDKITTNSNASIITNLFTQPATNGSKSMSMGYGSTGYQDIEYNVIDNLTNFNISFYMSNVVGASTGVFEIRFRYQSNSTYYFCLFNTAGENTQFGTVISGTRTVRDSDNHIYDNDGYFGNVHVYANDSDIRCGYNLYTLNIPASGYYPENPTYTMTDSNISTGGKIVFYTYQSNINSDRTWLIDELNIDSQEIISENPNLINMSIYDDENNVLTSPIDETQNFIIKINYSYFNGTPYTTATCSFNLTSDSGITSGNATYNTTSLFYESGFYDFNNLNNASINYTCDTDSDSNFYDITNINITLQILSIDAVSYTNNMTVESTPDTNIIVNAYGDVIDDFEMNITYYNGTLINTTDLYTITLNQTQFNKNGNYNISLYAIDDDGTKSYLQKTFYVNDSIFPQIFFINPTDEEEILKDEVIQLEINFSDVNLYAYEIYIINPSDEIIYNFTETGLSGTSKKVLESISFNFTGTYTINATVTDDHTSNQIKDYDIKIDEKKKIIIDDKFIKDEYLINKNISIEYIGEYAVLETKTEKNKDRYNFEYNFNLGKDRFSEKVEHKFKVECENIDYISDSEYNAHFVCYDNMKWIDFESDDNIKTKVYKNSENSYYVELETKPKEKLLFKSIGGLNTNTEIISFEVYEETTASNGTLDLFSFDFTEIGVSMLFFSLIILFIGLYVLAFTFNNFGFGSFAFFIGIFLGIMISSLHILLSIIFIFINIYVFFQHVSSKA
jgi:hypothetical protein